MISFLKEKQDIIKKYAINEKDSGSSYIQVALMSHKIKGLTEHLSTNKSDNSAKKTLLQLVARRSQMLNYIKRKFPTKYDEFVKTLGIRIKKS